LALNFLSSHSPEAPLCVSKRKGHLTQAGGVAHAEVYCWVWTLERLEKPLMHRISN